MKTKLLCLFVMLSMMVWFTLVAIPTTAAGGNDMRGALILQPPTWNEIITDPVGDQFEGVGPDIVGVDSSLSVDEIAFRVRTNETIDWSNFGGMTMLNTDQNKETGRPPFGTEYLVFVSKMPQSSSSQFLSKLDLDSEVNDTEPFSRLLQWVGPGDDDWKYVVTLAVFTDATSYWTIVPLSLLGPDEGNMDVVQGVGTISPDWQCTDIAPNPPPPPAFDWNEIITDPVGDQFEGVGPDIVGVDSSLSVDEIAFRVRTNETIDWSNFGGMAMLNTDQNKETGRPPFGTEYLVFVSKMPQSSSSQFLSKLDLDSEVNDTEPFSRLLQWVGPGDDDWKYVATLAVFTDATSYWTIVPLSLLGPDEGNMDVVQGVGTISPDWQCTDIAPNPPPPPAFDAWNYDEDSDGVISKTEALNAVVDYFAGTITKAQALEVIALYFTS